MIARIIVIAGMAVSVSAADCLADGVTPREKREGKVTVCSKCGSECYTAKLIRAPVG